MGFLVPILAAAAAYGVVYFNPAQNAPLAFGIWGVAGLAALWLGRSSGRWALMTLVLAAVALGVGVAGIRTGQLPTFAALGLGIGGGVVIGSLALLAGLSALFAGRDKLAAGVTVLAAAALLVVPVQYILKSRTVPPIHDITTNTDDPPAFVAIVKLREGAPNKPDYAGAETAELQKKAYPDLAPVTMALSPEAAFDKALTAAQAMPDWQIVEEVKAEGRIEATATTAIMGFKDDIVIRVRAAPDGSGSTIDIRSKSRVGRSDMGANAERIRAYVAKLKTSA
ncbi:MAG TPA: DUF1499 domain-containing protein [Alphaproteobacteria bacterium]|nr:DUF1499 domain-containing protein [Alphaproteobacteria bacterium]